MPCGCPNSEHGRSGGEGGVRGTSVGGGDAAMWKFVVKRLLLMIPTLFGVAVLIFLLLRVVPGDIVEAWFAAGQGQSASTESMTEECVKLGLDKPLWQQFATWVWGLVRLDLGISMWTGAPITQEIK